MSLYKKFFIIFIFVALAFSFISFINSPVFALTALPCEETNTCESGGVPAPTVTFTASPSSIIEGASSTLSWSATGASSCSAPWTTSTATSGTKYVFPLTTTSYSITCSGYGGSTSKNLTVNVSIPTTRILDIYISGTGSVYDTASGLTCSTSTCSWTIDRNKKIVLATNPSTGSFTGACSGYAPCTITMNIDKEISVIFPPPPTLTLKASPVSPSSITPGGSATSTITVTSTNIKGDISLISYPNDTFASVPLSSSSVPGNPGNTSTSTPTTLTVTAINGSKSGTVIVTGSGIGINGDPIGPIPVTIPVTVTAPPMSGTCSVYNSPCTIASGSSSCNANINWTTTNPQGISAITSSLPSFNTIVFTGNSGNQPVSIPFSWRPFYLYNNGQLLCETAGSASCTSGTSWDGSKCAPVINGICSNPSVHNTCAAGTSANPTENSVSWNWNCNGSNGGRNATCAELKQYTLTINKAGNGSGTVTGAGTYPYNTSVTATATANAGSLPAVWSGDCNSNGQVTMTSNKTCIATFTLNIYTVSTSAGANGTISPSSRTVNYGGTTTFTVTPNSGYTASASGCGGSLSGTTYTTGSITNACTVSATFTLIPIMSGTLSVPNCNITANASSCSSTASWSITNPEATPTAITASGMANINVSNSLTTPQSGTQSVTVPYPSRTFYLYNNAKSLVPTSPNGYGVIATASCESGTTWNSSSGKCKPIATPISVSISANPQSMTLPSNSTTLNWTTNGSPTSCTASGDWSGAKATLGGSENRTGLTARSYIYTIICSKSEVPDAIASATVTVGAQLVMSGILNANPSSCYISAGKKSCDTTLTWKVTNPINVGASVITSSLNNSGIPYPNFTVATGDSGGMAVLIPHSSGNPLLAQVSAAIPRGSRDFYLYNAGEPPLARVTVTSDCIGGTFWQNGECTIIPSPPTASISLSSGTITSGDPLTITWSSTNATSCTGTGFNTGGATSGSVVVYPTTTTTYSLSCDNGATQAFSQATITVSATKKEPKYKEN